MSHEDLLPPLADRIPHEVRAKVLPPLPAGHLPIYPHGKPVALEANPADLPPMFRWLPSHYEDPNHEAFVSMDLATFYRHALKRLLPAMKPRDVRSEALAAFTSAKALGLLDAINWFLEWHQLHILQKPVAQGQTFLPDVCTTHPAVLPLHTPTGVTPQNLRDLVFILPSHAQEVRWTGRQWMRCTASEARNAQRAGHPTALFATPGPCPPELAGNLSEERKRALDEWANGGYSSRKLAHVVDSMQVTDVRLPGSLRACSWTLLKREPMAWVFNPDPAQVPQRFIHKVVATVAHSGIGNLVTNEFHVSFDNALAMALREAKQLVDRKHPHLVRPRAAGTAPPQIFQ